MTVFQGTSFSPDTIAMMTKALNEAVETLPEPVSSGHVQTLAKNIVDLTSQGERDPERLKLLALLALRSRT
jgi:N12 class adenine-specific DNA methylase